MFRRVAVAAICFNLSCATAFQGIVSDEEILEKLEFNQERISSFRGMAKVYFSLNGKKGSVETLMLGNQAGDFRIETGNFFGVPLTAMTIWQDTLTYYIIPEEKIYIGKPAEKVATQVLPLGLTPEDVKGLMLFSRRTYTKLKRDRVFKIEFDTLNKDDRTGFYYPAGFKLSRSGTEEYVLVRWEAFDLNPPPFPSSLFQIQKPAQARLYYVVDRHVTPLLKGTDQDDAP